MKRVIGLAQIFLVLLSAQAQAGLSVCPRMPVTAGSAGQFISAISASGAVTLATPAAAQLAVAAKTSNFTLTSSQNYVTGDATGGAFTFTLPAAATAGAGYLYILKKIDSSTNQISITRAGSDTIDGNTTLKLNTQYDTLSILSDGVATWSVYDHTYPTSWTSYTLTITGSGSNPTKAASPAIDFARWRRTGDSIEYEYTYQTTNNTSAAAGSGTYIFQIPNPSVWTIDTAKQPVNAGTTAGIYKVGDASVLDPTNESYTNIGIAYPYNNTGVGLQVQGGGTNNATNSFTKVGAGFFALTTTTLRITFTAKVPITDWF